MATASKLVVSDYDNSGKFANSFRKLSLQNPQQLIVGEQWFYIPTKLENYNHLYIYFVFALSHDATVELYRSTDYDGDDTNYAVPIPDATLVASAGSVRAIDFNISNYMADRLWIKITANAAMTSGTIDKLALLQKP